MLELRFKPGSLALDSRSLLICSDPGLAPLVRSDPGLVLLTLDSHS